MESRRITLRDIAAEAGVNRATVSRALNGHPSLPEATCVRIREIAARLGYISNPLVSSVMSNARNTRTVYLGTLAYVTAWPEAGGWRRDPIEVRHFKGAFEHAKASAYLLEEFNLKERKMSPKRMVQILKSRGIEGLLVAPLPASGARRHLVLEWAEFSCVAIGYSLWRPVFNRVASHYGSNLAVAMHQIRQLGYSRVGLAVQKGTDERVDHNLLASFQVIQERNRRLGSIRPLVFEGGEYSRFKEWFSMNAPDVVLSFGGPVLGWLARMQVSVPGQVGFVELDLAGTEGQVAGVDQCPEAVAQAGVDLLISQLYRKERGQPALPKLMLIQGRWIDGKTLPRKA